MESNAHDRKYTLNIHNHYYYVRCGDGLIMCQICGHCVIEYELFEPNIKYSSLLDISPYKHYGYTTNHGKYCIFASENNHVEEMPIIKCPITYKKDLRKHYKCCKYCNIKMVYCMCHASPRIYPVIMLSSATSTKPYNIKMIPFIE